MHSTCASACQPQPITPRLVASGRARWRAATALAAPVRRWPSRSASMSCEELGPVGCEERDEEPHAGLEPGVALETGDPELEVGGGHDVELPFLEPEAVARAVLDHAAGKPLEARLDRLHRVGRREERFDVGFAQVERHGRTSLGRVERCIRVPLAALDREGRAVIQSEGTEIAVFLVDGVPHAVGERLPPRGQPARPRRARRRHAHVRVPPVALRPRDRRVPPRRPPPHTLRGDPRGRRDRRRNGAGELVTTCNEVGRAASPGSARARYPTFSASTRPPESRHGPRQAGLSGGDAPERIRTSGLSLRRAALYPLSYGREAT